MSILKYRIIFLYKLCERNTFAFCSQLVPKLGHFFELHFKGNSKRITFKMYLILQVVKGKKFLFVVDSPLRPFAPPPGLKWS